jgi:hypothetical protein
VEGDAELEAGPGGGAGVGGDQVAALGPGQLAGDVEPEPEAATGLQAGEALEDPLALGGRDTAALVLDGQDRLGPVALPDQPHQAVLGRVLAGVVDQVAEDLQDRVGGQAHRQAMVAADPHPVATGARLGLGGRLQQQLGGVDVDPLGRGRQEAGPAVVGLGGQQELLDQHP